MKIKAAVLRTVGAPRPYSQSRPLTVEQLDLAPPGTGEVLVRIAAAGLCHSDLSVINGDRPRPVPMALGHEAAGVDFSVPILEAIERKVAIKSQYAHAFDNRHLAIL